MYVLRAVAWGRKQASLHQNCKHRTAEDGSDAGPLNAASGGNGDGRVGRGGLGRRDGRAGAAVAVALLRRRGRGDGVGRRGRHLGRGVGHLDRVGHDGGARGDDAGGHVGAGGGLLVVLC